MKDFIITSLNELLKVVEILNKQYGSRVWYRGQADQSWDLIPSIHRNDYAINETYITNDFYIRVKQVIDNPPAKDNFSAWMAMMQHYGLPTRLLDWSMSPLIAAFFATEKYEKHKDVDACIWALFPRLLNKNEGFGNFVMPNDAYSVQQMLVRAFKNSEPIDNQFEDKIIACCSTEKDLRMYSQQATFTVHNSNRKLTDICTSDMLYKIIIPKANKEYFFESLSYFGINQSFIYPDMEHIAYEIKNRKYNTPPCLVR
jgi:hypothetical protein